MCQISDCNTSLIVSDLLSVVSRLIAACHASTTHSPYNTQTCSSYADQPCNNEQRARQEQCATTPTTPKALSPYNSQACPPTFATHAPYQNHVRQAQASQEQAEVSPNYRSTAPRSPDETGGSRSTPTIYDDYIAHKEPTSPILTLNNSHSSAAISNEHVTPPPTRDQQNSPIADSHIPIAFDQYPDADATDPITTNPHTPLKALDTSVESDQVIYQPPPPEFGKIWHKINEDYDAGRQSICIGFFEPYFEFLNTNRQEQAQEIARLESKKWSSVFDGINENNIKQASLAELVKAYQRQSNFHSRHWQDFAAAHQLPKNPRQAPTKSLHSFLATHGCQVPTTSIHYAPWVSTPTCPLKSFPGPPEPTTFHCENDLGRSYSFTAITSKNPTSTHANLMIYGIFSDQL